MKNAVKDEDGIKHHICNFANDFKVQEWILDKCCKCIKKEISRVLKCKNIKYYIKLCITDPPGAGCQDNHKMIWYGQIELLDFFRKVQADYPNHWMKINATDVDNENDIIEANSFLVANASVEGENFDMNTDVNGLIRYVWQNANHIKNMTEKDNKSIWGLI